MFWVIQEDTYSEYNYELFLKALIKLDIPHAIVKPVPFFHKIVPAGTDTFFRKDLSKIAEPEIDHSQPLMVCGSITLGKIARKRGWFPGVFQNENFDYEKWRDGFGKENLLNEEAVISPLKDSLVNISHLDGPLFIRPSLDTKSFSGTVKSLKEFVSWHAAMNLIEPDENSPLDRDTIICISECKTIYSECRSFIVDGKVITSSMYMLGDAVRYNSVVDERFTKFAQDMTDTWQPDRAFVMDIADTPDGLKVIEINCINSAGFYSIDVDKFIMAIESMDYSSTKE